MFEVVVSKPATCVSFVLVGSSVVYWLTPLPPCTHVIRQLLWVGVVLQLAQRRSTKWSVDIERLSLETSGSRSVVCADLAHNGCLLRLAF